MNKISSWVEAMRLRTLPVSLAGVVAALAFNLADGTFKVLPAALCLVFAVLCQIASNFANEYYDYRAGRDRAGREGPRRGVTEGDITPSDMKRAVFLTLLLAAVAGLCIAAFGGWWLIAAGVLIGVGALAYSAGPWPLSTHCLGEAAVIFFFGIIPVNLTYYVQAHAWNLPVFMASLAIGLMGANVLIVNNYRDIPDDKAVGKHTLATVFGRRAMLVLYALDALVAAALTFRQFDRSAWALVPMLYAVWSLFVAMRMNRLSGRAVNPMLGLTALTMFVYSLLLMLSKCC